MKYPCALTLLVLVFSIAGCAPATTPPPAAILPTSTEPPATAVPAAPTAPPATAVPTPTEETSSWEEAFSVKIDHAFKAAAFLDERFGLTIGTGKDTLRYTTDGGQTWAGPMIDGRSIETYSGYYTCRFGMDIVDAQVAWTCGGRVPATLSVNGGQNWSAREQPLSPYCHRQCYFLGFLDDTTGWAASQFALAMTEDGGETWTELALPQGVGDDLPIAAIALHTVNDGYLLDSAGVLHVTQDGGQSWSARPLGLELGARTISSAAVRFSDTDHGLVVVALVGGGQNEVLSLRTTDGGQTWEQEVVPSMPGTIYLTHDGAVLTITSLLGNPVTVFRYRNH